MKTTRRGLLKLGASAALAGPAVALGADQNPPKRSIRIAHLTDLHVTPALDSARWAERCLEHCQQHRPDLLMISGDMVHNALGSDRDRVRAMWDLYLSVLRANTGLPVVHCLGNHDVWGWTDRARFASEPGFGKAYALDRLGLERSYRSFTRAGWHFIVLDSTHAKRGNGYFARLDDSQFEWLRAELAEVPRDRPVLVLSHIPIVGVSAMFFDPRQGHGPRHVPAGLMHSDAKRLGDLFRERPNVKACLAGHVHMVDRAEYHGVWYLTSGAVAGAWWQGPFHDFAPGYRIVDLWPNGVVRSHYHAYGWRA